MSSTEEDDDLDTGHSLRHAEKTQLQILSRKIERYAAEVPELTSSFPESQEDEASLPDDLDQRASKRQKLGHSGPVKVQWSDGEDINDGHAAYLKFKQKNNAGRRSSVKQIAKPKKDDETNDDIHPRRRKEAGGTGVGRQVRKKIRKVGQYDNVDSDDELMEWTLPDYLQKRRTDFDTRREKLKEAGLQLPPTYDDIEFSDDERMRELVEKPVLPHVKTNAPYKDVELPYSLGLIPAPIAQYLRSYQVEGASFLHEMFVYQRGGILGDDMGLGKTIQVIAFLTAAYGKTSDERDAKRMRKIRRTDKWYPRTLIVCPGSLMSNWRDELNRWGWWHVDTYHGPAQYRDEVLKAAQSGRLEVVITTYTTYRNHADEINMVAWDCVVADEFHQVKERKAEITKAMIKVNALCRVGLTGTAIQNKYEELWTLLNWTNPGLFGPIKTWKKSVCEPLKLGQSHDASTYQLATARKTAKQLVHNLLPRFFLRRMKTLIKDQLPQKTDRVVFCPLTTTQAEAYQNFLDSELVQIIKTNGDVCDCGSRNSKGQPTKRGWCCYKQLENGTPWQALVFPAIQTLQKLSNHLAILIPHSTDPSEKQAKDLDILQVTVPQQWKALYDTRDSIINYANPEYCGKWKVLKKLLNFWKEQGDNKVLIFSHSVRLLKMLQALFISTSYNVSYLDGSMSYEDRFAAVQDFNSDPTQFVFLISTKAGGVGLNITSANKVVVVDPNWNPSYDLQAQDRAYRIGQTRDVEVFRLVSQGTMEEIVYARQIYKQQQANIGYNATSERRYFQGVQDRTDQKGELFGLQNLFAYHNENVILRDIVNKTNIAESRADVKIANLDLAEDEETTNHENNLDGESEPSQKAIKPDPEKEDAMMSQLAAQITGKPGRKAKQDPSTSFTLDNLDGNSPTTASKQKHDPVLAILSSVGVSYTHENSEVVGSSKVEARLSKQAEARAEAAKDQTWSVEDQQSKVFSSQSQSQHVQRSDFAGGGEFVYNDHTHRQNVRVDPNQVRYKYHPPDAVKRRQFRAMAEWAGYDDQHITEFALLVESWTPAQRREYLDRFYRWRKIVLRQMNDSLNGGLSDDEDAGQKMESDNGTEGNLGNRVEPKLKDEIKDEIKTEPKLEFHHDIKREYIPGTIEVIKLEDGAVQDGKDHKIPRAGLAVRKPSQNAKVEVVICDDDEDDEL